MRKHNEAVTAMPFKVDDEAYLRKSFDVARRALSRGNHPFGALLVSDEARLLLESENGFLPDHDMTAHAERLLATAASKRYDPVFLRRCTMYASAEPCAMCAGAGHWAGCLRAHRTAAESNYRRPRRESDARFALSYGICCRAAAGRSGRSASR